MNDKNKDAIIPCCPNMITEQQIIFWTREPEFLFSLLIIALKLFPQKRHLSVSYILIA
jgi:hypothetical protein